MILDWDDAYANGAYIDGADEIVSGWAVRAGEVRKAFPSEVIQTGPGERQFVDLYRPKLAGQGLTVVVHGGYWMAFSGRDFAHLVRGPLERGQAVAALTYTLAPDARIADITQEIAQAVRVLAERNSGPIRLIGHSAGGHLVTRMMCEGVLPSHMVERIEHIVSISGVHDLRPLLRTRMNETLRLTEEEARQESPALCDPVPGLKLTCVVGSEERPEFRRQSALLANIWTGMDVDTRAVELPEEDHFSIIAGLEGPDGHLTKLLLD